MPPLQLENFITSPTTTGGFQGAGLLTLTFFHSEKFLSSFQFPFYFFVEQLGLRRPGVIVLGVMYEPN